MDEEGKNAPVHITEDEAALYDRQIRLWGLEAQQRMRNATICVVQLRGTATETIKNIVLAGIGKLILVDGGEISEEDLGAGFFFRDGDVGKKRVLAAKARIESLNPLVIVEAIADDAVLEEGAQLDSLVKAVDLVCVTDCSRQTMVRVNTACRAHGKAFYAGGSYGLLGYIFCDLLKHEFIAPDRSAAKDAPKSIRTSVTYAPLDIALQHRWSGLSKRQTKQMNPAVVFSILALWEYQASHTGALPDDPSHAPELESMANAMLEAANLNKQVITRIPSDLAQSLATTAAHEFSPVCAVVGGMLAQDILKALAARESPIVNFYTFDGNTGGATICTIGMQLAP